MKKLVLSLLFFAFLCSTQLFAQGARLGFKAGLSYSQITGYEFSLFNQAGETARQAPTGAEEGRYGFAVAFLAEFPINDKISFQPEFAFSSQGNKYEGTRFDNLQLPLGLRINFNQLFVIAGPQAGIKISDPLQSENYKSIDFSAFGGIGYHFNESVFIEARFTRGFLEVFEDDSKIVVPFTPKDGGSANSNSLVNSDNFLVNNTGKNQYFTLSVGYRL